MTNDERRVKSEEAVVAARTAEEMRPEELLRLAAEKLEGKRGKREKTAGLIAAEARRLAERVERF